MCGVQISRRSALLMDAIDVVERRLMALSPSQEVDELRERVVIYREQVHEWQQAKPSAEQRDKLMKLVLALHVAVAKAERL
jgi:hypothetical protein